MNHSTNPLIRYFLPSGTSRVGLPSNPSSRKNSVYDITQQHLPVGLGNAVTSPPSDDEDKRITPRWKGSGTNLPPTTPKQALSMLKQASSATNVSHGAADRQYYLGSQLNDSPKNARKGSMYNLKATESPQRKDSVYGLPAADNMLARQRKASVYAGVGVAAGGPVLGATLRAAEPYESPETMRKHSIMLPSTPTKDSPSMSRKPSMVPSNASAKNLKNLSDSSSNLSSTVSSSLSGISTSYGLQLGPGQIHPKGYRLSTERHGELKMGFSKVKGTVEVEVSSIIDSILSRQYTM